MNDPASAEDGNQDVPFTAVATTERLDHLDLIRGVAVLGILMMNMPAMGIAHDIADVDGVPAPDAAWFDVVTRHVLAVVAEAKFVTIFSILFGAGLELLRSRAEARDEDFEGIWTRRSLTLLGFGIAHGVFLWFGDILTGYALLGFLAFALRRMSSNVLFGAAVVLLVLGGVLYAGLASSDGSGGPRSFFDMLGEFDRPSPSDATAESGTESRPSVVTPVDPSPLTQEQVTARDAARVRAVFCDGTFGEMVDLRRRLYLLGVLIVVFSWGARTLALFLLGMWLVRSGRLVHADRYYDGWKRLAVLLIPAGWALQALVELRLFDQLVVAQSVFYVASIVTAIGYVGAIVVWSRSRFLSRLRERVAAVGRMAFTNYLAQSLLTAILFNYLGFFDRWRNFACLMLTFGIYAIQVLWSASWLRRFRFGPFEWIWRSLTYGRVEPMRRVG